MKIRFTLVAALVACIFSAGQAQNNRFVDPIYEVADRVVDTFGRNIDPFRAVLASQGAPVDPNRFMEMDVYQPEDEEAGLRPVVVLFHTGNFLPRFWNVGIFGTRRDSAIVEFANRLAELGYVSISADYREGWDPGSTSQDTRTGTLLQAAYRGGQDAHMMARFLRRQVEEEGNPYRIDTSRIVLWGFGTGGYVSMTHAFLDRIEEVLADERFFDENDQPYVSLAVNSNPQGTTLANLPNMPTRITNVPNHVGYSSDVAMSINTGGALGDLDWMEGKDNEPIVIGTHHLLDANAPFSFGNVIVPTTRELVVGDVGGTEQIVETANMLGLNDAILSANATDLPSIFSSLSEAINVENEAYKMVTIDGDPTNTTGFPDYELSHDNMFPLAIGDSVSGTYNYTNEAVLRASIQAYNATPGVRMIPEDDVIADNLESNPNLFTPAAARLVIDTIMAHFIPRAYIGLDLDALVATEDLLPTASIGLEIFPNPSTDQFTVAVNESEKIRSLQILDIEGRVVRTLNGINNYRVSVDRNNLPRGIYIVQLRLDQGVSAQKVVLK